MLIITHNAATCEEEHMYMMIPCVIAYAIDPDMQHVSGSAGVYVTVSSMWMLLNLGRALNSGWEIQLQSDAPFNVCTEAVGELGFGVNSLGAHCHHS